MRWGIRICHCERSVGKTHDRTAGRPLRKGNDLAPLVFSQAGFAPRSRTITQTVNSLGIETHEAFAHRLGMAPQFVRNRGGSEPLPASDNHPGPLDPIARCMPTLGKSTNLAFFNVILRFSGSQEFRHRRLPHP